MMLHPCETCGEPTERQFCPTCQAIIDTELADYAAWLARGMRDPETV